MRKREGEGRPPLGYGNCAGSRNIKSTKAEPASRGRGSDRPKPREQPVRWFARAHKAAPPLPKRGHRFSWRVGAGARAWDHGLLFIARGVALWDGCKIQRPLQSGGPRVELTRAFAPATRPTHAQHAATMAQLAEKRIGTSTRASHVCCPLASLLGAWPNAASGPRGGTGLAHRRVRAFADPRDRRAGRAGSACAGNGQARRPWRHSASQEAQPSARHRHLDMCVGSVVDVAELVSAIQLGHRSSRAPTPGV